MRVKNARASRALRWALDPANIGSLRFVGKNLRKNVWAPPDQILDPLLLPPEYLMLKHIFLLTGKNKEFPPNAQYSQIQTHPNRKHKARKINIPEHWRLIKLDVYKNTYSPLDSTCNPFIGLGNCPLDHVK